MLISPTGGLRPAFATRSALSGQSRVAVAGRCNMHRRGENDPLAQSRQPVILCLGAPREGWNCLSLSGAMEGNNEALRSRTVR